jgi:hypothetical protein
MYKGTSNWLRNSRGIENEIAYRDIQLSEEREKKRIGRESNLAINRSDNRRRNSIADMLGRSRSSGSLVECGRFLEVCLYPEKGHIGEGISGNKPERKDKEKEENGSVARRVNHRARKQIRRIVNANDFRGMLTLTIAPPSPENNRHYYTIPSEEQRKYEVVRRLFKNFVERCRKAGYHFEYLAVFELHNSEKTSPEKLNTWHIHLAVPAEGWIEKAAMLKWWHGIVDFQDFRFNKKGQRRLEEIHNPGAYISEYIGKEGAQFGVEALRNKRRYTTSRGVKRPMRQDLSSVELGGDFEILEYKGKKYKNVYYNSKEIPGTDKLSINAVYIEVGG